MSKKKRKQKRPFKQSLRHLKACPECFVLASASSLIEKGLDVGATINLECPYCKRNLKLPISKELFQRDDMLALFRRFGHLIAKHRNIPATKFTFSLDGEILFTDSADESSDPTEDVLVIRFESEPAAVTNSASAQ